MKPSTAKLIAITRQVERQRKSGYYGSGGPNDFKCPTRGRKHLAAALRKSYSDRKRLQKWYENQGTNECEASVNDFLSILGNSTP